MTNVEIHKELCDNIHRLYKAKNSDYGNSYGRVREIVPNSILVFLNTKIQRLNNLLSTGNSPNVEESVEDTLLDLANYCMLELIERELEREVADVK